jgi:hypothetical protein
VFLYPQLQNNARTKPKGFDGGFVLLKIFSADQFKGVRVAAWSSFEVMLR